MKCRLHNGDEKSVLKTVGGHLKEGWKTMKEEAVKINRRIKESKVSVHPFYDE